MTSWYIWKSFVLDILLYPTSLKLSWVAHVAGFVWVVGKSDFNENPVICLDLDINRGFVKNWKIHQLEPRQTLTSSSKLRMKSKFELIIGDWLLTSVLSKTKIETLSNKLIIVTAQQQPQFQQQNNHNFSWVVVTAQHQPQPQQPNNQNCSWVETE